MLITSKNIDRYFPDERFINVPRLNIFLTFFVHMIIMFIGLLLFTNVLTGIAVWIVGYELVHTLFFLRKVWRRAGYSEKLFYILFTVFMAGGALLAEYIRRCIGFVC